MGAEWEYISSDDSRSCVRKEYDQRRERDCHCCAWVEKTRALATTAIKDETLPCAGHNYQYGDMSENAILMHERRPLQ